MVDCLLTILVNQICRLFSTHQTPDSIITRIKIILPQAIKTVIPPLTGTIISIFKATAILSVLAINDIIRAAQRISSYKFKPLEIYATAAILAFLIGYLITRFGNFMENKSPKN